MQCAEAFMAFLEHARDLAKFLGPPAASSKIRIVVPMLSFLLEGLRFALSECRQEEGASFVVHGVVCYLSVHASSINGEEGKVASIRIQLMLDG